VQIERTIKKRINANDILFAKELIASTYHAALIKRSQKQAIKVSVHACKGIHATIK
jgi:hypothetical protein